MSKAFKWTALQKSVFVSYQIRCEKACRLLFWWKLATDWQLTHYGCENFLAWQVGTSFMYMKIIKNINKTFHSFNNFYLIIYGWWLKIICYYCQQDEITEMQRKLKIMNHQIDQLKEEITSKEQALVKEHLDRQRVEKEKDNLKVTVKRFLVGFGSYLLFYFFIFYLSVKVLLLCLNS